MGFKGRTFVQDQIDQGSSSSAATAVGGSGTDIYISDTDAHTGTWKAMVVLAAATFTTLTDNGGTAITFPTATSIPAGTYIRANGVFTAFQLSAGSVSAIRV